jgi:hypothetical protein
MFERIAAIRFGLFVMFATVVACGGEEPAQGGDTGVDAADSGSGDTSEDVVEDVAPDVDTGPQPECGPGQARCVPGAEATELCDEFGFWQRTDCEAEQICVAGECREPGLCEPLTVDSCTTCNRYVGCDSTGTREGEFDVPFTLTCQVVDGVAQLVERVCLPGETRCADTTILEGCDECGLAFEVANDCRAENETTLCDLGECVPLCEYIKKRKSYIGCEYWAVDLDNAFVPGGGGTYIDADGQPFAIVVSNPNVDLAATVTVSWRDGVLREAVVQPGELHVFEMHEYSGISDTTGTPIADLQGTMVGFEAFQVQSTVPIIAYQFNPLDNETVYSNDASLLFPTSSLGTEYLVMTRRQTFDILKGYVTVVGALEGTTRVTVELPEYTLENPVETLAGIDIPRRENIPRMRGGETRVFELEQFMVLNIETDRIGADLTGTRITSDRPVAVFGGSEAANAPNDDSCVFRPTAPAGEPRYVCEATRLDLDNLINCENAAGEPDIRLCTDFITCCADHIEHQMLPLFAWGREYVAARSAPRGDEADIWRIMAGRDGVNVELVGLPDTWFLPDLVPRMRDREFTLDKGEWFEFPSPVDFEIVADGPIMVGQFLSAEQAPYASSVGADKPPHTDANTGDPAFILAVPVEQYRSDYTFLAPNGFEFDYVTITAPFDAVVELDGVEVAADVWQTFGDETYKVARVLIADGVHSVVSDLPIGLTSYGYDSYVSYGYAAGLDIREIFGRD